jgi:hypothetical protein
MRRILLLAAAFVIVPAVAFAYPPATLTSSGTSITASGLDCGTNYEIRVRDASHLEQRLLPRSELVRLPGR